MFEESLGCPFLNAMHGLESSEEKWVYAAIDTESKLLLEINVFSCRGSDPAVAFLHQLTKKLEIDETEFLVDAGGYLTAIARHELSGQLNYSERNHVENCPVSTIQFRRETVRVGLMARNVESQTKCSPNWSPTTASEFHSLLDAVDSEFIAKQFDIGTYTNKHDFENHLKVGVFEGINPSDSLAELAEKTATHDQFKEMAASTFSRRTNDRAVVAVVRIFFELLHSPQLYHQRSAQRKRLNWLDRAVITIDEANLVLTRSVAVPSELHGDEVIDEITPGDRGLKFNLAVRVRHSR